ncbi:MULTISPECIES: Crp/Fnr family transcriptional regulator [Bacillaceae]|uniref:Crp/Fnr family transcriptional regulator n=1 Tax=Bacillaceae TaxID=186817 RepID=UPI00080AD824|nr:MULTISPECIES: Crp/Fnr family transcriptional regulator [Bacillaceae]OCA84805.1 Crp/Fnr family transcriptional regulator [Bacillus sp. FJAT-27986]
MKAKAIQLLRQVDLFSCLSEKEIKELEPFIYERTYKKGQYLFFEGDPRLRIYILLEGFVMLEKSNQQGSLLYTSYVKKNTVFPYMGLFKNEDYNHSAVAETDIRVFYMVADAFESIVAKNSALLKKVILQVNELLAVQENRVKNVMTPSAHVRVLNTIDYLMNDLGEEESGVIRINCPITTTKISVMSGTSRETVSMVVNKLKKDQILSIKDRMLHIHKPEYFEEEVI